MKPLVHTSEKDCPHCAIQEQEIARLKTENQWLKEQFLMAQKRQFGSSSEKSSAEQLAMVFNEAEVEASHERPEPKIEQVNTYNRRTKGQRDAQLKGLPIETIIIELTEDQRICKECNSERQELPEAMWDRRSELVIVPMRGKIVIYLAKKYGKCNCGKCNGEAAIKSAPMPETAFPNSIASPSLVAQIISQKFTDALPLYRQEQIFSRLGMTITRQNMANWVIKGADWLENITELLHEQLLSRDILHSDDTVVQVLHEPGKTAQSKSYMWLYRTGRDGPPIILYDYQTSREGKHPGNFLKGFTGYLQSDGYQGFESVANVKLCNCWAHARRYFDEAITVQPKNDTGIPTLAETGLDFCNRLYAIEHDLRMASDQERLEGRKKRSVPVLNAFRSWLENNRNKTLPKSHIGKAFTYCLNQWPKLLTYLQDGRLEIDNNRAERSIKPFVIGRKNWLFANSQKGAKSSAIIYSIIETAKENGLIPYEYIKYLFEQLPCITSNNLPSLLPWSDTLPEYVKMPAKKD
jgi:transposase